MQFRRITSCCALVGAALAIGCGSTPPATASGSQAAGPAAQGDLPAPATAQRADLASVAEVIDGEVDVGARVRVRGYVIAATMGCLDMVCETDSGCCGACGGDAVLVASASPPHDRFLWLSPRTPDGSSHAIGRCSDSNTCDMTCTPPSGVRLTITGEVVDAGSGRGLIVDRFAVDR